MKSTHNKIAVAVITETVMPGGCLEQAGAAMRVPAFLEIDQTTRNGP